MRSVGERLVTKTPMEVLCELHGQRDSRQFGQSTSRPWCRECSTFWPCQTFELLERLDATEMPDS